MGQNCQNLHVLFLFKLVFLRNYRLNSIHKDLNGQIRNFRGSFHDSIWGLFGNGTLVDRNGQKVPTELLFLEVQTYVPPD